MALRELRYDVCMYRSSNGAWENQVAVDIAISPHVDLCLGFPNGNRLANQEQLSVPHWLHPCCGHIASALQSVATKACVFVGDASLSPGVKYEEAFKYLVPIYHQRLFYHGIPVVSNAQGIKVGDDGVHWDLNSLPAVLELINRMVQAAADTNSFTHSMNLPLWHWRFNSGFQRHYPCCSICDRDASDQHLDSKTHKHKANGTLLGFDFPDREKHCTLGFKFFTAEAVVDTTATLPADQPMRGEPCRDRPSDNQCTSFTLRQQDSKRLSTKSSISQRCQIDICMDGVVHNNITCVFLGNGQARDGFGATDRPLAFKSQKIVLGIRNRNEQEWEIYHNTPKLRQFLPRVYGYFEQDVNDTRISFLLVDRLSFTFAELTTRIIEHFPSELRIILMLNSCERVLNTLVLAAQAGIKCHDWHTGNIAFMDDDVLCMKLIDWEGNGMALASESYCERIDKALKRFLHYLPGPHKYNELFHVHVSSQSRTVQDNIGHWRSIMTEMSDTLLGWWNTWKDAAMKNQLPSSDEMKTLFQRCHSNVLRRVTTLPSQQPQSVSSSSFDNIANTQDSVAPPYPSHIATISPSTYFPPVSSVIPATISPCSIPTRCPTVASSAPTLPHKLAVPTLQTANVSDGLHPIPEQSQLPPLQSNDTRVRCNICTVRCSTPTKLEDSGTYKGTPCPLVCCGTKECHSRLHIKWLTMLAECRDTEQWDPKRLRTLESQEHTHSDVQQAAELQLRKSTWEYGKCASDITADRMAMVFEHSLHQMDSYQEDIAEMPSTRESRRVEGVSESSLAGNGNAITDVYLRASSSVKSAPSRLHGSQQH